MAMLVANGGTVNDIKVLCCWSVKHATIGHTAKCPVTLRIARLFDNNSEKEGEKS